MITGLLHIADIDTDVVRVFVVFTIAPASDASDHLPHGRLLFGSEAGKISDVTTSHNQLVPRLIEKPSAIANAWDDLRRSDPFAKRTLHGCGSTELVETAISKT